MDKGRGARQNNWYVHIRTIIISISTTILQIHGNSIISSGLTYI